MPLKTTFFMIVDVQLLISTMATVLLTIFGSVTTLRSPNRPSRVAVAQPWCNLLLFVMNDKTSNSESKFTKLRILAAHVMLQTANGGHGLDGDQCIFRAQFSCESNVHSCQICVCRMSRQTIEEVYSHVPSSSPDRLES